jgi:hypothetical protein
MEFLESDEPESALHPHIAENINPPLAPIRFERPEEPTQIHKSTAAPH